MKKILLLVIVFVANMTFAQDVIKTSDEKNTYILNGDIIEATLYHDNGVVAQIGTYTKENKLDGKWESFDISGNKVATAYYQDGKKVGTWTFFNGDEMSEVSYKDSAITEVKTWKLTNTQVVSN